jgi:hypothetical protein
MKPKSKTQIGNQRVKNLVKNYKKMGTKKFFSKWAEGMEGVTPIQQARMSLLGNVIILVGLVWGIIYGFLFHLWAWLIIILFGSLVVLLVSMLGAWQKFKRFKLVENAQKEMAKAVKEKEK